MDITFRHLSTEQHTQEKYKHGFITAWKEVYEEYDKNKDKWNKKSQIICHLKRNNKNILNLGECNDGSKFTSINQAINVAKGLCNYDEEREIEKELRKKGFKNEYFFEYNSLKDLERIKIKTEINERPNTNINPGA